MYPRSLAIPSTGLGSSHRCIPSRIRTRTWHRTSRTTCARRCWKKAARATWPRSAGSWKAPASRRRRHSTWPRWHATSAWTARPPSAYFDLLEDLLIATRVPVFTKRAERRMTTHPKFFLFDVGVYRAIRPTGPLDSPEQIDGPALETLVFQELRAAIAYRSLNLDLFLLAHRVRHGSRPGRLRRGRPVRDRGQAHPHDPARRPPRPQAVPRPTTRWRDACCCSEATAGNIATGIELLPLAEALADPTLMLGMR